MFQNKSCMIHFSYVYVVLPGKRIPKISGIYLN